MNEVEQSSGQSGMKRLFLSIPFVIAVVLGVMFFQAIGKDPNVLPSALIGKKVPAFSLPSLQNPDIALTEQVFDGKVTLLNVWATWCPSCVVEHPYLLELSRKGVRVAGLNYKDERGKALEWLERLKDPYDFVINDPDGRLGFDLGVYGAPETFVIDSEGVIHYRLAGVVDEKVWKEELEPLYRKLSAGARVEGE